MRHQGPPVDEILADMHAGVLATSADFAHRRIYLFGPIDTDAAFRTITALHLMDQTEDPITILLNSPGGAVEDGFAIYDAIRHASNPVLVMGYGGIMSMGAIIMQAADLRAMSPHAIMMVHNVSLHHDIGKMTLSDVASTNISLKHSGELFVRLLKGRSRLSERQVRDFLNTDTYLDAEAALKYGLIDGIIETDKKLPALIKRRDPKTKKAPAKKKASKSK